MWAQGFFILQNSNTKQLIKTKKNKKKNPIVFFYPLLFNVPNGSKKSKPTDQFGKKLWLELQDYGW